MAGSGNGGRRMTGGPPRARRRWAIAAAVVGVWLLLRLVLGSLIGSLVLLLLLAALAVVVAMTLRSFGIGRDHPLVRGLATRPWRDGREVLHLALRHLSEVFIVMPNGSLLAPSAVEVCMNPADLESLADVIDLALVDANAAEAYEAEVGACSARIARDIPVEVNVVGDPEVPPGRYRLRQRKHGAGRAQVRAGRVPVGAGRVPVPVGGTAEGFHDGFTRGDPVLAETVMAGEATVSEAVPNPLLRLVTGGMAAETRISGARAGRGDAAELVLPAEPTVSRVHARFACTGGEWWITVLGTNGVALNGTPLTGDHVIRDGDSIQWGRQAGALVSRVEVR
jgi:FHA domain